MFFLALAALSGFAVCHSIDIGGIISGNRMGGVALGRSLGNGQVDVEGDCQAPGLICLNCTHAVTCVALPVGWLKVPRMQCAKDETCNAHLGRCSKQAVPECDDYNQNYEHVCEQVGIFPDAFDCRKFHLCSPPADMPWDEPPIHRAVLCPKNYAYNPLNAQCSIHLPRGQCHQPVLPPCKENGETGVFPGSPNHYYMCLFKKSMLYPQVFLCPNGWTFHDGICKPVPVGYQDTQATEPSKTEHSTTEPNITEPTTAESSTTETVQDDAKDEVSHYSLNFFSMDKTSTYAPDTFLADKFDLSEFSTEASVSLTDSYETDYSFEQ